MDDDEVQQFNLRWHNHQTSMIGALSHMYTSGLLTDVTLSANGTPLKAHRLVLASCSRYFAQLFKDMDSEATLVVVLSCSPLELRLLLSFMYTGEVTASKRTLPALLKLANTLQVAGLADNNPTLTTTDAEYKEDEKMDSPINLENKNDHATVSDINPIDNNSNFRFNFENNTTGNPEMDRRMSESGIDYGGRCDERLSKLDQIVQNLYSTHRIDAPMTAAPATTSTNSLGDRTRVERERDRGRSVCSICNKRLSNQYNLRVHMETHAGALHACRACAHVSRSRDALRKHRAYRHPRLHAERL